MTLKEKRDALYERARQHPECRGSDLVFARGSTKPKFLIIGAKTKQAEVEARTPFIDEEGKVFDDAIRMHLPDTAVSLMRCIPFYFPDKVDEMMCRHFREEVLAVIKAFNPKYVICVDKGAADILRAEFKVGEWQPVRTWRVGCMNTIDDFAQLVGKLSKKKVLREEFILNKQQADNQGHTEMISGVLAGLHIYAKKAGTFFKDINQRDECIIGDKKVKVYTRDALSDGDMLVYESYFSKHPEIDIYICCKIKGGKYEYLGYATREVIAETRTVQMIGEDSDSASADIRRIFEEQYKNLSDVLEIWEVEEEEELIVEQKWVPLHMHSEYSIGDGFGTIPYVTEELRKKGFKGAALTDHGTLAGTWEFQKHMLLRNMKPIMGCEIYTKLPDVERRFHTIVLVKNEAGWKNLLKLQAMANREHFYYKPVVPFEELLQNNEGLIVTSGCCSSPIPVMISKGQFKLAEDLIIRMKEVFGDDFYLEIQPHIIEDNQIVMKKLLEYSKQFDVKAIITTDAHYPNYEDKKFHDAIKSISMKKKYPEGQYGDDCFFYATDEELLDRISAKEETQWMLPHLDEWKAHTIEVLNKVNFEIKPPTVDSTLPVVNLEPYQKGYARISEIRFIKKVLDYNDEEEHGELELNDQDKFMIQLAFYGLMKLGKLDDQEYEDRLCLEIRRTIRKRYTNYFLMFWEIINFCEENNIRTGPGRGSAGSSLLAMMLGITKINPIEHGLLYTRFISAIRKDFVDIDEDFADNRRSEVFDFFREQYGTNNCAKVMTYSRFHPKGVLRDIGRIFDISGVEINKIASMTIERSGGDARKSFSLQDTFDEFAEADEFRKRYPEAAEIAMKLEGMIRHRGIHAAAMVTTHKDIAEYAPIGKLGGEIALEWPKQLVEDMKLIKFDILGLSTLSIIQDAVQMCGEEVPHENFNDPKVYENVFQRENCAGIFQFDGVGLQKLSKSIKVANFDELTDCTALYRPGSLHSGSTQKYINKVQGKEEIKPLHPLLNEITHRSKHEIVYQEDIMMIMFKVGAMSWSTAEMSRKIMTKSKGADAFNKMRKEFVENAFTINGMPREEAEKLYDIVSMSGSYSFNRSHAAAYSMLSYQAAWLKTYHPDAFFAATLKHEGDKAKIFRYIQDAKRNGVEIEYPDINISEESYCIKDGKVYAGLNSINGIASKSAQKILKHQPFTDFKDFLKRVKPTVKILKGLIVADAFRSFDINKKLCYQKAAKVMDFNFSDKLSDDFGDIEWTKLIYELTTLKPRLDIREVYEFGDHDFVDICSITPEEHGDKQCFIRGVITDVINKDKLLRGDLKKHTHQFEHHMLYLNTNDGTGDIAMQINPWTYELHNSFITQIDRQPIIAYGTISKDGKKMYCDILQVVDGPFKNNNIDKLKASIKSLGSGEAIITSAQAGVSKKGNSYYRITMHDGAKGLCFRSPEKLFPGMKAKYKITKEPFIDIQLLKE